jgi:hypothetical protein
MDVPPELVALRRAFDQADQECERIGATFPRAVDIAAGIAEPTPEQRDALIAARAERLRILEEIQQHPWWATLNDQRVGREALRAAARG